MKRVSILFVIMLLTISHGYADTNQADHWEKVRQMEQLAERFKADTGFTGEVMHSTTTMRLHVYRGNFPGVSFTADSDTTAFRQACEGIITKVLPYSKATRGQLYLSRISKSGRGYTTDYYQQVNGYRVEGAGYIMITFEDGGKFFSISDNTVQLPEGVQVNIARDKAISIALDYFKAQVNPPEHKLVPYVIADLRFCNPDGSGYALKYIIYLGDFVYYVDSSTGRIDWGHTISDDLSTFHIKGKVYSPFDYSIPPAVYSDSLSMSQIEVKVNNLTNYTNDAGEASPNRFQARKL